MSTDAFLPLACPCIRACAAVTEPLMDESEDVQEARMAADTNFEDEDGSWHNILRTYPAWRGFSVRVNNIPLETTPEQLADAFGGVRTSHFDP